MPAGSESSGDPARHPQVAAPPLPHTWRPLGVRLALWAVGTLLIVLVVGTWVLLPSDLRGQFTPFQRGTLVFIGVLLFVTYYALIRCRVTATEAGLTVVNGYRVRRYEWSQVIGMSLRRGAPWATLDLSDGTTISVVAIQGSDGGRARTAVREIRACIVAHTPMT